MKPSNSPRVIELRLRDMKQLFNSMDPSPFNEKDLDHDAEEFIVDWAKEYPFKAPLVLTVYLEDPGAGEEGLIREGVHHYFGYRAKIHRMEFGHFWRQARVSFLIGFLFLSGCLFSGNLIATESEVPWTRFFSESLTIVGWVAMWRPIQMCLYDWWPLYWQIRIYEKLGGIPVEVRKKI